MKNALAVEVQCSSAFALDIKVLFDRNGRSLFIAGHEWLRWNCVECCYCQLAGGEAATTAATTTTTAKVRNYSDNDGDDNDDVDDRCLSE